MTTMKIYEKYIEDWDNWHLLHLMRMLYKLKLANLNAVDTYFLMECNINVIHRKNEDG